MTPKGQAILQSLQARLPAVLATMQTKSQKVEFLQRFHDHVANDEWDKLSEIVETKATRTVGIKEFIESRDFLNMRDVLYPIVMDEIQQMNGGDYVELVLTGAIGTGKTTIALITTAYQLYLLAQYDYPQRKFGLDPASEIVFIFQSLNAKLAKDVDYARFKAMIDGSPWFQQHFRYDKTIESELQFPNRIIVKPVSGAETAAIGQNVFGGVIDELNFMAKIEGSKRSVDGGNYDQATSLYNSIARRRKSRFMKQGKMPGILCLVSSVRYPGQFTDTKIEEQRRDIDRHGSSTIFVYNKTTWGIKPPGTFTGSWFEVFTGSASRSPRILQPNEVLLPEDQRLVISIPEEYRTEFEKDMMNALRDIAGVATLAMHPYIIVTEKITECADPKLPVLLSRNEVDFVDTKLKIYPERITNPTYPRFAHVDLGLTGDSAGVVIGHVVGFMDCDRGDHIEQAPKIVIDAILEVSPPRNGEILFWKIRDVFYALKKFGMNIKWITFDSYQSADSLQLLRQAGFIADIQSMDKSIDPYEYTKSAIYDGRLKFNPHPKLQRELASLELDTKRGKVDHPPGGSKDCSDALAGVVYGLTMRREVWAIFGVRPLNMPTKVKAVLAAQKPDK